MNRVAATIVLVGAFCVACGRSERTPEGLGGTSPQKISGPADGESFGRRIAIDGDTMLVGASDDHRRDADPHTPVFGTGVAYILEHDAGTWRVAVEFHSDDLADGDGFGCGVALDRDIAIVGANGKDNATGAAYVFYRDAGGADAWGQVARIPSPSGRPNGEFGWAVTVQGDTAVVGEPSLDGVSPAVHVFRKDHGGADNWGLVKTISAPGPDAGLFGWDVALDDDLLLVVGGTNLNTGSNPDAAYVFGRDQGGTDNWGMIAQLAGAPPEEFFIAGDLADDVVVLGAFPRSYLTNPGSAYVYRRNAGGPDQWGRVATLRPRDLDPADGSNGASMQFGYDVAIDREAILVAARFADTPQAVNAGAAYVFRPGATGADDWPEVAKFWAPDGVSGNRFGESAAWGNEIAAVYSPPEVPGSIYIFR